MDAGVIAYGGQRNLFDRLDVLSNNVANSNTTGFKADFNTYYQNPKQINGKNNPLPAVSFAFDTTPGGMQPTGRPLDVAIDGNGYFQIETPLGPRFTRNGSFFVNAESALVTKEGYAVSGDGGPINVDINDDRIVIGENGEVTSILPEGNENRGTLGIFKFAPGELVKAGNSYFSSATGGEAAVFRTDFRVAQGMLETSNVNPVQQMTELVSISRDLQSFANIIEIQHQMYRSAVQRLSAVQ